MSVNLREPSTTKIIVLGNLIVNLPVTIIIIFVTIFLTTIDLSFNISLMAGIFIGWLFWDKFLKIWKGWAFRNGVSQERIT